MTQPDITTATEIEQALRRLRFVSVLTSAWNVEDVEVTADDLGGLGLFLDDIVTILSEIPVYQEAVAASHI